jgi:hypothetical protein
VIPLTALAIGGSGANVSMPGTTPRSDGQSNPGDPNGEGVDAFGARWY